MEINIVCVGQLKEKYFKEAVQEYQKRISGFCKINIIELKDYDFGDGQANILKEKRTEAEQLAKYKKGFTIALEIEGEKYDSEQFAKLIKKTFDTKSSCISFFIGGSNGLQKQFSDSLDMRLSFSTFTFPHQLMRVILLEQVYRALMINSNRSYHK